MFTIFGLLELPPDASNSFRDTYSNLKRQGSMLLRQRSSQFKLDAVDERSESPTERINRIERGDRARSAPSSPFNSGEINRNLGSVTWVLDPKLFSENPKSGNWMTEELWLPIKEFANPSMGESRVSHVFTTQSGASTLTLLLHFHRSERKEIKRKGHFKLS